MKKLIVILTACAVCAAPAGMRAFANESDDEAVVIECTGEQNEGTIIECTGERTEEQTEEIIIECTIERTEGQNPGLWEPESGSEQAAASSAANSPAAETYENLSNKDENDMAENTAEWMGGGESHGISAAMNDCFSAFVNDGYSSEIASYKAKLETLIEYGYALPYDTAPDAYAAVSNYEFP